MSAADAIHDNYVHACATVGTEPDLDRLHEVLLDDVIHGYDVIPSAVHLTASTLALRNPEVMVENVQLYSLPLGGDDLRLGSIEFIATDEIEANGAMVVAADRHSATGQSVAFAKYVREIGADVLMVLPPDWAASCTPRSFVEHYAAVAEQIPVMVVTGVFIPRGMSFGLETL